MKLTKLSISMLLLSIVGCRNQQLATRSEYLKQYAFCKCLSHSKDYNYAAPIKDDISQSIYLDISGYPATVYHLLDSVAADAATQIKPSVIADHDGHRAVMIGCFNFYKSKTLDSLVKKIQRENKLPDPWH